MDQTKIRLAEAAAGGGPSRRAAADVATTSSPPRMLKPLQVEVLKTGSGERDPGDSADGDGHGDDDESETGVEGPGEAGGPAGKDSRTGRGWSCSMGATTHNLENSTFSSV